VAPSFRGKRLREPVERSGRVDPRRPLAVLVAAVAVALAAQQLPAPGYGLQSVPSATGPVSPAVAAPPPAVPAPPPAAPPPCTALAGSLRPTGPVPPPGAVPAGSTMAAIVARGALVVGVDQGDYLTGYRNPATGELAGADIDLAHLVAGALFGDPNRVRFVVLSVADRAAALQRRQVDLVADVYTVTCARQRQVAFSTDYLQVHQRLLVPVSSNVHELQDLDGRPVCTSLGSSTEIVLRRLKANVVTLTGIPDCMVALQRGQVAAVSSDDVLLAGMAAQDPSVHVTGRSLDTAPYALGMNLQDTDLVRFVNAVLDRARADGTLAARYRRWFTGSLDPVPLPPPARYRD
jgi:polar amino acid transport system substrate-binding protein